MSEDVIGKLESFTPAAVDRDALLFAAGRASVKPSPGWKWLAGALGVTQALTLAVWLAPRPAPHPVDPIPAPDPVLADEPVIPVADPYSLLALRHNPDPRSAAADSPTPVRPPLMAFTRDFQP
jgi:hypothetical protein